MVEKQTKETESCFSARMVQAIYEQEEVQSALISDDILNPMMKKVWDKFMMPNELGEDSYMFRQLYQKIEEKWQREAWKKTLAFFVMIISISPQIYNVLHFIFQHLKIQ